MSYKNIPRLYLNKELSNNMEILLATKDSHYLKNVLRLTQKKIIRVFNGVNGEWEAIIYNKDCNKIKCSKLIKRQQSSIGPSLYFSLIKNHNLRWLLEKSTELGVKNLHPIITDRVNLRNFNYNKAYLHLKEASEVSGRLDLPKLFKLKSLEQIILDLKRKSEHVVFCNESRKDNHLSSYFKTKFTKNISFIIGPEGGFSDNEIDLVNKHNFVKKVKIHDRVLKAETAAVLVLSIYNNYLELID